LGKGKTETGKGMGNTDTAKMGKRKTDIHSVSHKHNTKGKDRHTFSLSHTQHKRKDRRSENVCDVCVRERERKTERDTESHMVMERVLWLWRKREKEKG